AKDMGMASITIEEAAAQENSSWQATISFNNGPRYTATITDPFSQEQEEELEWYFEEYLRFPFTDQVKATRAATSIQAYGETLFNQLFSDRDGYAAYKQCVAAGLHTMQIEVAGSPAFHALHWEALKGPKLPRPLALQATMLRKNLTPPPMQATVQPSPTI